MGTQRAEILMQELTDSGELAKARKLREQFDRNSQWLQSHIADVYTEYRGKCICIAGQEAFIGDTLDEAIALATATHPEDEGWFTRYIPLEKVAKVYAI